jgi:hypothetical protein
MGIKKAILVLGFLFALTGTYFSSSMPAMAANPVAGDACNKLWGSVLEEGTNKPLICAPLIKNDLNNLAFRVDTSEFPPALETPEAIAFGRTCPDSLGIKEKDGHGNLVECLILEVRRTEKQIWYSNVIAQSILNGTPIPKLKPTPSPEPKVSETEPAMPSPSPEVTPTEVPSVSHEDEDQEVESTKKRTIEMFTLGAGAIAIAMGSHAVATVQGAVNTNPTQPSAPSEPRSPKDLLVTEVEARRRKKSETFNQLTIGSFLSKLRKFFLAVARKSILSYEVISDGNYLRVYSVWLTRTLYSISMIYGLYIGSSQQISEITLSPLIIMVMIGLLDASAGFLAAFSYIAISMFLGLSDINTQDKFIFLLLKVLLLIMLVIVPNFIGSSMRPMDRDPNDYKVNKNFYWDKLTDIVLTSVVSSWVGSEVIKGFLFFQSIEVTFHEKISAFLIFFTVCLIRHGIQLQTFRDSELKAKRKELEISRDEIGEPTILVQSVSILLKLIVTTLVVFKILNSYGVQKELNSSGNLKTFLISTVISGLFFISDILKFFSKGPEARSNRLGFLNLQSPIKLLIILLAQKGIAFLWHTGDSLKPSIATSIYIIVLLVTFFGVIEVYVKPRGKKNDKQSEEPYTYSHQFVGIAYISSLIFLLLN